MLPGDGSLTGLFAGGIVSVARRASSPGRQIFTVARQASWMWWKARGTLACVVSVLECWSAGVLECGSAGGKQMSQACAAAAFRRQSPNLGTVGKTKAHNCPSTWSSMLIIIVPSCSRACVPSGEQMQDVYFCDAAPLVLPQIQQPSALVKVLGGERRAVEFAATITNTYHHNHNHNHNHNHAMARRCKESSVTGFYLFQRGSLFFD